MSYWLTFDCQLATPHQVAGGSAVAGGTTTPELNVTYNYSRFFLQLWPDDGIQKLCGMTARQVIQELDEKLPLLSGEPDADYWAATEGNARKSLLDLRYLASICPPDATLDVG